MFGRDDDYMLTRNGTFYTLSLDAIGFITFIVFLILKVTGSWTEISWFWVFFPLWIPLAIDLVFILIFILIFLIWYR